MKLKMMIASALWAATVLPLSGTAWAAPRCELDGRYVDPYNGATTAGLSGMMRCKEADTGLPSSERELRGGVFMGLSRYFDAKGNVQRERMRERGRRRRQCHGWIDRHR